MLNTSISSAVVVKAVILSTVVPAVAVKSSAVDVVFVIVTIDRASVVEP